MRCPCWRWSNGSTPRPGRLDTRHGAAVIASIARAVALTRAGATAAVVTNPIHKATLYAAGFGFPGHTEFLAELAGGRHAGDDAGRTVR